MRSATNQTAEAWECMGLRKVFMWPNPSLKDMQVAKGQPDKGSEHATRKRKEHS